MASRVLTLPSGAIAGGNEKDAEIDPDGVVGGKHHPPYPLWK